jgi:hypothetical protein
MKVNRRACGTAYKNWALLLVSNQA